MVTNFRLKIVENMEMKLSFTDEELGNQDTAGTTSIMIPRSPMEGIFDFQGVHEEKASVKMEAQPVFDI